MPRSGHCSNFLVSSIPNWNTALVFPICASSTMQIPKQTRKMKSKNRPIDPHVPHSLVQKPNHAGSGIARPTNACESFDQERQLLHPGGGIVLAIDVTCAVGVPNVEYDLRVREAGPDHQEEPMDLCSRQVVDQPLAHEQYRLRTGKWKVLDPRGLQHTAVSGNNEEHEDEAGQNVHCTAALQPSHKT